MIISTLHCNEAVQLEISISCIFVKQLKLQKSFGFHMYLFTCQPSAVKLILVYADIHISKYWLNQLMALHLHDESIILILVNSD